MTMERVTVMGRFSQTRGCAPQRPRDRLRAYLERDYRGRPTALAREAEISVKAAENALNGHWPQDETLRALVLRFGRDVWDALFAPDIEPVLARLTQEEREAEERLEAVRRRRCAVEGGHEGRSAPPASTEDRSFRS